MNIFLHFTISCLLAFCFVSVSAGNVQLVTNSSASWNNGEETCTATIGDFNVTLAKNNSTSSFSGVTSSPDYIQILKGSKITIAHKDGLAITKVVITCKGNAQNMTIDGKTVGPSGSTLTWEGSTTSFEAVNEGTPVKVQYIDITYGTASASAVDAPTVDGTANFVGTTTVTIKGGEGTVVYYTTDGTAPTTASTTNGTASVELPLTATTTVKAIAVKGDETSAVTSATFTAYEEKTIAELVAMKNSYSNVALKLTDAKVIYDPYAGTAYAGYQDFVRQDGSAIMFYYLLYNQGIAENSLLNGTIFVDYMYDNGTPAIMANAATDVTALSVTTSDEAAVPTPATLAEIKELKHAADLVAVSDVTITSGESAYYGTTYYLNDADGNKVECATIYDADLKAKADDGNKYNVKAVFGNCDADGLPQLIVLGELKDEAESGVMTIADLVALKKDTANVNLKLTNAKIICDLYNDMEDYRGFYSYVREDGNAIMFYSVTYGEKIPQYSLLGGTINVDYVYNNGIPTVTANTNTDAKALTVTASDEEAVPTPATISEINGLKHAADIVKLTDVTLTSGESTAYGTMYYLTDEQGNTIKCPTINDADFKTKAGDGIKYDVVALFGDCAQDGTAQLTVLSATASATGISSVTADKADSDAPMYNLAGQKVGKDYKGVVVKSGKKYLVK